MEEKEYFDKYEDRLIEQLVKVCSERGALGDREIEVEEALTEWNSMAPEYMTDAVTQINSYPAFTLAVAGYVGMAVARGWDENWEKSVPFIYRALCGPQGFDYADEHILQVVLGYTLESGEARFREDILRACAHTAMSQIRHEEVESQTSKALYILARSARAMFRIGLSIELHSRGYRYERMVIPMPTSEQAN